MSFQDRVKEDGKIKVKNSLKGITYIPFIQKRKDEESRQTIISKPSSSSKKYFSSKVSKTQSIMLSAVLSLVLAASNGYVALSYDQSTSTAITTSESISSTKDLQLQPTTIEVNGLLYTGNAYISNGRAYVNEQELKDFINTNIAALKVTTNDNQQISSDSLTIDNKSLIPLRETLENTGYYPFWNEVTGKLNVDTKDYLLNLTTPIFIEATMLTDASIYSDSSMSKKIAVLPKGSYVTFESKNHNLVYISSGNISGWTRYSNLQISNQNYLKNNQLPTYAKEFIVNNMGYTSKTDRLIWVNKENTTVNVFQNTENDWKLIEAFPCSIGKNSTPTPNGVFETKSYQPRVPGNGYVLHNFVDFYLDYGLHSYLLNYNGTMQDGRMNQAISHGCVRMIPDDVKKIYDECKAGTTTVIR